MSQTYLIVNGDRVMNPSTGRPVMVADDVKVRQDVREMLSIETQPNGFGAGLEQLLGQVTDPFAFRVDAQRRVRASVSAMQRLQDQFVPAERPDVERIAAVTTLSVTPTNLGGGTAKTAYAFRLVLRTVARGTVTANGVVVG